MNIVGIPSVSPAGAPNKSDVVIVTDVSGSMKNDNKLKDAKAADTLFVNSVNAAYTHVGLVKYSDCLIYQDDFLG